MGTSRGGDSRSTSSVQTAQATVGIDGQDNRAIAGVSTGEASTFTALDTAGAPAIALTGVSPGGDLNLSDYGAIHSAFEFARDAGGAVEKVIQRFSESERAVLDTAAALKAEADSPGGNTVRITAIGAFAVVGGVLLLIFFNRK